VSVPVFRSISTANGSTKNAAGTLPADSVEGDYLLAAVRNIENTPSAISTVPDGWNLLQQTTTSGTPADVQLSLYAKVSTGEAGPWTWVLGSADAWTVDVIAVTGKSVAQVSDKQANSTAGTTQTAPTVTATSSALLFGFWACNADAGGATEAGMTERADGNGLVIASEEVAAGATGTRSAVTANSVRSVGALVALTAASSGDFLIGSM